MYRYVLNNPVNVTDPTGLWCVWKDNTHDDDVANCGASQTDCQNQGGHWDKIRHVVWSQSRQKRESYFLQ